LVAVMGIITARIRIPMSESFGVWGGNTLEIWFKTLGKILATINVCHSDAWAEVEVPTE
jgi:hypothetical protein